MKPGMKIAGSVAGVVAAAGLVVAIALSGSDAGAAGGPAKSPAATSGAATNDGKLYGSYITTSGPSAARSEIQKEIKRARVQLRHRKKRLGLTLEGAGGASSTPRENGPTVSDQTQPADPPQPTNTDDTSTYPPQPKGPGVQVGPGHPGGGGVQSSGSGSDPQN